MSLPYQVPINGTYQKRIPPGSQTNLYYILLSNLPWQTSWQQLKDHVRVVCPVERVEVFNESTTGWVSVRGRDNFDAAFELLNGGIFNGRPLFADGKNATDPVMIKEPVDVADVHKHALSVSKHTRRSSPPTPHYRDVTPAVAFPVRPVHDQWLYNVHPTANNFQIDPNMHETMCAYNNDPAFHHMLDDRGFKTHRNQSTLSLRPIDYASQISCHPVRPLQSVPHQDGRLLGFGDRAQSANSRTTSSSGYEEAAGIRVVIRHIAPHVTYGEFLSLLRRKLGHDADSIVRLDLPVSDSYDSNIGFAVATFCSEHAAFRTVRKFHGLRFESRVLKAEVTPTGSHNSTRSRKPPRGEKKEIARSGSHHDNSKKSREPQEGSVIIANGSSSTRKPFQKL
ncbi:hypothetical protein Micbo1qcDRAFT_159302 [Microdochium bolleyi]|uniref:RRM domain-containing protein n=1 Tax=Microdochium bolleyi TaxID=196109 RepID=A0A136JB13_9PEZI|nr:hypothetical protein Micbo1qcDRAFT_159302 [Microdochium bolleyi]